MNENSNYKITAAGDRDDDHWLTSDNCADARLAELRSDNCHDMANTP